MNEYAFTSNPTTPSSASSSSSPIMRNAAASAAMLFKSEDDLAVGTTTIIMPPSSMDDTKIEAKPLLSRDSDATSNSIRRQRRRRVASEASILTISTGGGQPFRRMGSAASDTFLITRLSFKLLRYLGDNIGCHLASGMFQLIIYILLAGLFIILHRDEMVGYRWITRFLALGCYAFLLIPGFIQVGYYYFFSNHIRRGVVYGDQPRNRLDLYLPENKNGEKPVVAFVTGGAWIIGYKAWGCLLGQQLAERGVIVACIDYRNFPQGTIRDMIKDASQGISFVCNNIAAYGGDPSRIYLMGQSAGAHIAACTLLQQAIKEAGGEKTSWSASQIKAYFGLSGGYNLFNLVDHFHNRGLYRSIFLSIMEGEESLQQYSPELMVQDPPTKNAVSILPPVVLFHGTADYSIPSDSSKSFAETLRRSGVQAESILYEGKTHTDLFLQDPMRGGRDDMFEDLVGLIHAGDSEAVAKDATPRRRLVPECMLKLAHNVSPF